MARLRPHPQLVSLAKEKVGLALNNLNLITITLVMTTPLTLNSLEHVLVTTIGPTDLIYSNTAVTLIEQL